MVRNLAVAAAVAVVVLAGCSSEEAPASEPTGDHTHGPAGGPMVSPLVGDGTQDYEAGYRLEDVALPGQAGLPGQVRFRIGTFRGTPLKDYLSEQTKDLHLYVVREDLAVFRHLHPTIDDEGTWSARATLPDPGTYRVIAEFVARDDNGDGDHIMLGTTARVPGKWKAQPPALPETGDDGVLRVTAEDGLAVGADGRLTLAVRDARDRGVRPGSYLGTFAHVTAFHVASGSVVHMHPLGQPEVSDDGTALGFHTGFEKPGDYLAFVQVRVDGYLHTLPLGLTVR